MKNFISISLLLIALVITSCTNDKTNYNQDIDKETINNPEFMVFNETSIENYHVSFYALGAKLSRGYNSIKVKIIDTLTNEPIQDTNVSLEILGKSNNQLNTRCGYSNQLLFNGVSSTYDGYGLFPRVTSQQTSWTATVVFTVGQSTYKVNTIVEVIEQQNTNLSMIEFIGNDGGNYLISLIAPGNPKVSENELVAGVFKLSGTHDNSTRFTLVDNYLLKIDPRMPDPSMGNHSSPNNKDLLQKNDSLYYGIVNYTMTGDWTLNFMLFNANNSKVKGSEVPVAPTPGVPGVKSELFIDVKVKK